MNNIGVHPLYGISVESKCVEKTNVIALGMGRNHLFFFMATRD
jgi:hypothetical protein